MKIFKIATLLFVGALFLALNSGGSAQMQKDMKPVMPGVIQAASPTLTRVERTGDGYALIGSGFGTDRTQVQAFEGSNPVPTTAVLSVANDRVTVKSQASGTVQHKVVVAGRSTAVVSFTHPTTQAAGATGIGVAKSPGPQEQVKAGTLMDKPGLAKGLKDPVKEIEKGRDMGLGALKDPGKKPGEDIIGSVRGRSGQSDDPCAPKQDPAQAALDRLTASTKEGEKTGPIDGLTGKRKVTGGGAVESFGAGAQSGQSFGGQSFGGRESTSRPAKESGEKGGGGGTTQGGGTWSGSEAMVDRTDSKGGQTVTSTEKYKDDEGRMTFDSFANPDGSGGQTIRAENRDGTITTAKTTWGKDGKVNYSETTQTKEQEAKEKAEKEKADKEKAEKEKGETKQSSAGTSCRSDDDRCVNQFFSDRNDPTTKMYAERQRKEIAEKMAARKQAAVRPADGQATGPRRTEADLRRAAADKKRGLTQPADPDKQTAQADPCGPQQQIKDREKMVPGSKGIDPTPGEGYRKGTR